MTSTSSLMVHHGLRAAKDTGLPLRTVLGHWTREQGVSKGVAIFPGPRKNPGNVIRAHVGKVCGQLGAFPIFCTTTDGVAEYIWYFNNLSYYDDIAPTANGDWIKACNLIERSPWSADHYGGTLDATARTVEAKLVKSTVLLANVRAKPTRDSRIVTKIGRTARLAYAGSVIGQSIGGNNKWHKVRYGSGNGLICYIHDSVADVVLLP